MRTCSPRDDLDMRTKDSGSRARRRRHSYTDGQHELFRRKYALCTQPSDRERLFREAGMEAAGHGFNFAQRGGYTAPHKCSPPEAWEQWHARYNPRHDASVHLRRDPLDSRWTEEDDTFLREHWHGQTSTYGTPRRTLDVEAIAVFLDRSVWDCAARARALRLRHAPRYYDAQKVLRWTGLSFAELRELLDADRVGLGALIAPPAFLPCTDRSGHVRIILVSATALARALDADPTLVPRLIAERNADPQFLREAIVSVREIATGRELWECNVWAGYDSCSLNPLGVGFGRPVSGDDVDRERALKLDPRALAPTAGIGDDDWTPRRWREQIERKLLALHPASSDSD